MNDKYDVVTGADGQPVARLASKPVGDMVREAARLADVKRDIDLAKKIDWAATAAEAAGKEAKTAKITKILSVPAEGPAFCVPVPSAVATVEVAPGIMVSQHLIEAAVNSPGAVAEEAAAVERRRTAWQKETAELRQDIDASKRILQEMVDRARQPVDLQEKYVSYDAMPPKLQRVVKAYIDATSANKELDEAVKALQEDHPTT